METFQSFQQVAGFVAKTYEILNNDEFQKIIFWSTNGNEFIIKDITKFQEIVLPKYFRHRNVNSFIRQLNMYGFHKARKQNTRSVFSHPYFIKNKKQLLSQVKRKLKNIDQNVDENDMFHEAVSKYQISIKEIEQKKFDTPRTQESETYFKLPLSFQQLNRTNFNVSINRISYGDVESKMLEFYDDNADSALSIQNQIQKTKKQYLKKIKGISLIKTSQFMESTKYIA